ILAAAAGKPMSRIRKIALLTPRQVVPASLTEYLEKLVGKKNVIDAQELYFKIKYEKSNVEMRLIRDACMVADARNEHRGGEEYGKYIEWQYSALEKLWRHEPHDQERDDARHKTEQKLRDRDMRERGALTRKESERGRKENARPANDKDGHNKCKDTIARKVHGFILTHIQSQQASRKDTSFNSYGEYVIERRLETK
ncbi:MAG: hypothetical protein AAB901_01375, partial [Patescibacteria group bacterium]